MGRMEKIIALVSIGWQVLPTTESEAGKTGMPVIVQGEVFEVFDFDTMTLPEIVTEIMFRFEDRVSDSAYDEGFEDGKAAKVAEIRAEIRKDHLDELEFTGQLKTT
jgi:hypothetical protein